MSDEIKEESNSTPADVKEEDSSKSEEKAADESSKDSEKNNEKEESAKEESVKSESGKEDSEEDDDDEEEMALLDRPVEVTGCRARKKVERLEYSVTTPKEKDKQEIPEGKGQKLGECPRIEYQIQRYKLADIKPLHRILFNRVGSEKVIKKNIRKFSGFPFEKTSPEFKKKKTVLEKLTISVLKQMCEVLDIERSGTKDDLTTRIMDFLLNPKDSGKQVISKKKSKKKSAGKKSQKKKTESKKSDEEVESANDSSGEDSDKSSADMENEDKETDDEELQPKKKSKSTAKSPAAKNKTKKVSEKGKKEDKKAPTKGSKRKREESSDEDLSDEDKPIAKKSKMPSDDEITKLVKRILDSADLQEITMKKVIKQVSDAFPDFDLTHKKAFIKSTIKSLLNV